MYVVMLYVPVRHPGFIERYQTEAMTFPSLYTTAFM